MSISRRILVEQLDGLTFLMKGKGLDIGGEKTTETATFQRPPIDWKYLNPEPRYEPDYLGSAEDMPVELESFDTVLMLEVLEHVTDADKALNEAVRVLRPGGRLFLSMPFMYRHHRNPEDHIRWTHEKLFAEIEEKRGLHIEVFFPRGGWLAVVLNDLSSGLSMFRSGTFFASGVVSLLANAVSRLIQKSFRIWHRLDMWLSDSSKTKSSFHRFTIGYLVVARKPIKGEQPVTRPCPDILRYPLNEVASG